jgi:hypothetical protein
MECELCCSTDIVQQDCDCVDTVTMENVDRHDYYPCDTCEGAQKTATCQDCGHSWVVW